MILWDGRTRTAAAYAPETEGNTSEPVNLAVEPSDPDAPWVDSETGSRWSIVGRAVSGPRKGQTLRWLPGVMVKWYAWAAEYPKTSSRAITLGGFDSFGSKRLLTGSPNSDTKRGDSGRVHPKEKPMRLRSAKGISAVVVSIVVVGTSLREMPCNRA